MPEQYERGLDALLNQVGQKHPSYPEIENLVQELRRNINQSSPQIFLSYVKEDEAEVKKRHQQLSAAGFKPWMRSENIHAGNHRATVIEQAIRQSAFFMAFLSKTSVNMRGDTQRDLKDALNIWKEKRMDDIYLIPALLEPCEIPDGLEPFESVNLYEPDGWDKLVRAIRTGLERLQKDEEATRERIIEELERFSQVILGKSFRQLCEVSASYTTQHPGPEHEDKPEEDRVENWLKAQGFHTNPFGIPSAAEEKTTLPTFFLPSLFFNKLVGNPEKPQSVILFAPRGQGKTACRLQVGRIASEHTPSALAVNFTEFDTLLDEIHEKGAISLRSYQPLVIHKTLEILIEHLQTEQWRTKKLQEEMEICASFCALKQLFGSPVSVMQPPETTEQWVKHYQQPSFTFRASLRALRAIAKQVEFVSVYLLIDNVDELSHTASSPERALDILSPLLDAPGSFEDSGFAFKFFLPANLKSLMKQRRIGRLDRVPHYSLKWSNDQLMDMWSRRLRSYSRASETDSRGNVYCFYVLCEGEYDVDKLLVEAAHESPRELIALGRAIVEAHCYEGQARNNDLIRRETIEKVLKQRNQ